MKFMIPFLMAVLPAAPSRDKARPAATRRPLATILPGEPL